MTTFNKFFLKKNSQKVLVKMNQLANQLELRAMVNYKLSNTLKLMLKMNLPRDIKKMKSSVRNSE